jgi:pimeloyl-ACP methyl ester carboxylesterase
MANAVLSEVVGTEHRVMSDGFGIFAWEKRLPDPIGERVALLVHGATYSGATDFDVQTAGQDASLMDFLALRGIDVFTMDVRGYGRSEKPEDASSVTTDAATRDIGAVIDYVCETRGVEKVDLLGWSWGGVTTALYTSRRPEKVRRLVMYAGGASQGGGRPPATESWVTSTRESIMARIEQDVVATDAQEAFIAAALRWDARSPAAGRALSGPDGKPLRAAPEDISVPTQVIYGAREAGYRPEEVSSFFARLNTSDKALIVVPDAGHFLLIQKMRGRLFDAAAQWFLY